MATKSKSDEELLELLTEKLVDGFPGIHQMFKDNDPEGHETLDRESLLKVMHNYLGYVTEDKFERLLKNLSLDHKEKIPFDLFVSRFKEYGDIQKLWKPPIKRDAEEFNQSMAHPEEHLRDCEVPNEWKQLKVAPHARQILHKSFRDKRVDLRSLLPDQCYEEGGVVTKVQMRVALQQLGVELTDMEFKAFWDKYDPGNKGNVGLDTLYVILGMDRNEHEPIKQDPKPQTPVMLKPNCGVPPRPAAVSAREFATGHHKIRTKEGIEHLRVEGEAYSPIPTPPDRAKQHTDPTIGEGEPEVSEDPAVDSQARKKIANVKNQKPPRIQGNFNCVIDCLSHKFEEKANSLSMAFKLFDIYSDGSVMRIDFRRVLSEFGFPLTALQLPSFVHMVGQSINHGLISYKRLLTKLCNRTDAFVSQILDDKIAINTGGSPGTYPDTDIEVETAGRGLVEYIHQDFIKIASNLLRLDNKNRGVVSPGELKQEIERVLDFPITEKQWTDLQAKLPVDAENNIRYTDFMLSFKGGELGAWNMVKAGVGVTVPRNKVIHEVSEEVQRLERSKTEPFQAHAKLKKPGDKRPIEQIRSDLREFFKNNLSEFDRRFKELDRKQHKRFSRWQFGALLKLCGFPITEKELEDVWSCVKTSDDNMSTFVSVVTQFAEGFTSFRDHVKAAKKHVEDDEGVDVSAAVEGEAGEGDGDGMTKPCRAVEEEEKQLGEVAPIPPLTPHAYLGNIIMKVKPYVRKYWDNLREEFKVHDPHGFGSVTYGQMQRMIDKLRVHGLDEDERNQLCSQFDFKSIGRCNYLSFMKTFTEPPVINNLVYSPATHLLERKPKDAPRPITVNESLARIRQKLIRNYKNIRRCFQKYDKARTGEIGVGDFRKILKECHVPVTDEDLYHIMTEFDSNMNSKICYYEFLTHLTRIEKDSKT